MDFFIFLFNLVVYLYYQINTQLIIYNVINILQYQKLSYKETLFWNQSRVW